MASIGTLHLKRDAKGQLLLVNPKLCSIFFFYPEMTNCLLDIKMIHLFL